MEKILIGEIVSAIGIKGEVKIKSFSSSPERYRTLEYVYLDLDESSKQEIDRSREMGNMVAVKFTGIDTRNDAEAIIGSEIYIDESQLEELPEDTYYLRDLIGLKVYDAKAFKLEEPVGLIKDVLQNTAQDVYVIEPMDKNRDILVPAVKEFIKEVNIKDGYILIDFIEGML